MKKKKHPQGVQRVSGQFEFFLTKNRDGSNRPIGYDYLFVSNLLIGFERRANSESTSRVNLPPC